MTETTPEWTRLAREIASKLIPHTTSVHNVDVIAKALKEAHDTGRRSARPVETG